MVTLSRNGETILNDVFAAHPIFRQLSANEQAELLAGGGQRVGYAKGRIVRLQNERCDTLDLILEGSVVVQSIDEQGNALTISELGPGEMIGLNLLFSRRNWYPMTITAKAELVMLSLHREHLTPLCMHNQGFLLMLLESLSDRSAFLADRIKLMSAKSIRQSIIEFLNYEHYRQGTLRIELPFSKKELAERFGIPRTSLSRELQKMRNAGLIDYDRFAILLLKPELLLE